MGVAATGATTKLQRKLPQIFETVDLGTIRPEYAGFTVTLWINYPQRVKQEILSGDESRVTAALGDLVTDHDLVDFDGEPYPASGPEFWQAIPDDLAKVIVQALVSGALPKQNGRH
jgi:hypothetical protein